MVLESFPAPTIFFRDWLKVLRVHHYIKNLHLFVPLLAAHRITDLDALVLLLLAFVVFGLCASSV